MGVCGHRFFCSTMNSYSRCGVEVRVVLCSSLLGCLLTSCYHRCCHLLGFRWKWQQQTGMRGARGWYPWRGWSGPNRRGDNKNDGNRWRMDTCQMSIIGLGAEDRIGMSSFLFCIFFLDERWVASWVRVAWHEVARKEKGTYRVSGRYSGL